MTVPAMPPTNKNAMRFIASLLIMFSGDEEAFLISSFGGDFLDFLISFFIEIQFLKSFCKFK